jgi:hypothetical protein
MVKIRVFIEGGLPEVDNRPDLADIFDNSNRLRESFQKLLSRGIQDNNRIKIIADTQGGYPSTIKSFKNANRKSCLLIDLDAPPSEKINRINELKLQEYQEDTFFMIQTMETWILSQLQVIEECFEGMKKNNTDLREDDRIKGHDLLLISKPDKLLNSLMIENFEQEKRGQRKPLKYGKLKNSYLMIENLDINQLKADFEDVENLLLRINQ